MKHLKKLCVFCGTRPGNTPIYEETARELGAKMAHNHIELIYGAGGTGVMKAVAEGCKMAGGRVTGMTIQKLFDIERPDLMKNKLDDLKVYEKLFARKVAMTSVSDAFCVLPGGLGTLDELFELMVLKQLEILNKPIVILNINDFFDGLKFLLHQFIRDGFIKPHHAETIIFVKTVDDVLKTVETELQKITCQKEKTF